MLKDLDWNKIKGYLSPQSIKALDDFLDAMPARAGNPALIAAAIAWLAAGSSVLFASMQAAKVTELRTELLSVEALTPPVPEIKKIPVKTDELEKFVKEAAPFYKHVALTAGRAGGIVVTGVDTRYYPEFRAAIGHVQIGADAWRVEVDRLCVGRECKGGGLQAQLGISKLVIVPAKPMERKKK